MWLSPGTFVSCPSPAPMRAGRLWPSKKVHAHFDLGRQAAAHDEQQVDLVS